MLTPTRLAVLAATLVLGLAIACEGDSSSGNSEDDVKRDVTNALNAIFGDDLDVAEFAKYSTTECFVDTAELALVFAFLGDADIEFEVDEVELLENERALVTIGGSGDFLEAFGGSADGAEAELGLWVLQDGRCRNTSDCEDYDEERAALGLDTTEPDDFGGSAFGDDFGPPVDASVGDRLAVGNLTVTILGAALSSKARDDFSDAPQGVFVVVDFIFENDGQEHTSPWWGLTMSLFDDRDRTRKLTAYRSRMSGPASRRSSKSHGTFHWTPQDSEWSSAPIRSSMISDCQTTSPCTASRSARFSSERLVVT